MEGRDSETVVLVDEDDQAIGVAEKMDAHERGLLHRAFSVFALNGAGELLLQRRARAKYHSGGLWTNTCCSHPRPGEGVEEAARRRLREEMGIDVELVPAFTFLYRAELEGGLVEHELDHVLVGAFEGDPRPSSGEVEGWWWAGLAELEADVLRRPEAYTVWFKLALPRLVEALPGLGFRVSRP